MTMTLVACCPNPVQTLFSPQTPQPAESPLSDVMTKYFNVLTEQIPNTLEDGLDGSVSKVTLQSHLYSTLSTYSRLARLDKGRSGMCWSFFRRSRMTAGLSAKGAGGGSKRHHNTS